MNKNKYRAWNKNSKQMIVHEQEFIPLKVTSIGVLRLCPLNVNNRWELLPEDWFDLMQYTGLKDKNDVEIYEGDIKDLTGTREHLIVVVWNPETCAFCAKSKDGELSSHLYGGDMSEVIGNIYENPELLK